jgi:hypothetical protein
MHRYIVVSCGDNSYTVVRTDKEGYGTFETIGEAQKAALEAATAKCYQTEETQHRSERAKNAAEALKRIRDDNNRKIKKGLKR